MLIHPPRMAGSLVPGTRGLRAHPGGHPRACTAWHSGGSTGLVESGGGLGRGNNVNVGASLQLCSGRSVSQAVVEHGNSDLVVRELGRF